MERLTPTSSTSTESATVGVAPPTCPQPARTSSRIRRPLQRYSLRDIFQNEKYVLSGGDEEEEWYWMGGTVLGNITVLDCK